MSKLTKEEREKKKGKCPYCGSDEGYRLTETVRHDLYFTMDDELVGGTGDVVVSYTKCKKCLTCGKTIGKIR